MRSAPAAKVAEPLLTSVKGPVPVVTIESLKANVVPVRLIPDELVVVIAPLNVEVPPLATSVKEVLFTIAAVTFIALLMVIAPRAVVSPTDPVKVTSPIPAVRVREKAPLILVENKISPPPAPVEIVVFPARTTDPDTVKLLLVVI